jgi:transcription elongation GreA/GreB family factor
MDKQMREEKLKLWKKQQQDLEKQLDEAMHRKGAAAQEGDLSENAAYHAAIEEIDVVNARLASIKQMIAELEKGTSSS